jgi:NADH dehydrogenase
VVTEQQVFARQAISDLGSEFSPELPRVAEDRPHEAQHEAKHEGQNQAQNEAPHEATPDALREAPSDGRAATDARVD